MIRCLNKGVERSFHSVLCAVREFGFADGTLVEVPEQCGPNPDFPTVRLPNPEEGPDTLQLAQKLADARGISSIVANDPDADRFALAEKSAECAASFSLLFSSLILTLSGLRSNPSLVLKTFTIVRVD